MTPRMMQNVAIVLVFVALISLGFLATITLQQNVNLERTLTQRSIERDAQINTLLCVAANPQPTQQEINLCFTQHLVPKPEEG